MKKTALFYTDNKTNLLEFASYLAEAGWEIFSIDETFSYLKQNNIPVKNAICTGEKQTADSYFKYLRRILFAGKDFLSNEEVIESIPLVCINLKTDFLKLKQFQHIDSNENSIDLRHIAMLRTAAKNYKNVMVLTDPADYKEAIIQLKTNTIDLHFRLYLAGKAFNFTSAYDSSLAHSILTQNDDIKFPNYYTFPYKKFIRLKYGSNPHQTAFLYSMSTNEGILQDFKKLHGKELDYYIIDCLYSAWKGISLFQKFLKTPFSIKSTDCENNPFTTQFTPTSGTVFTIGIKNKNPIGAALGTSAKESVIRTRNCEPEDFPDSILGCSSVIDIDAAREVLTMNLRAIVAPDYTEEAVTLLSQDENIRLIVAQKPIGEENESVARSDGLLVQSADQELFKQWKVVTKTRPTQNQSDAMAFGMMIAMIGRSSCSVVVNDFSAIGLSCSQTNLKKAVRLALENAEECFNNNLTSQDRNAEILVSDSIIPFGEFMQKAVDLQVKAIIQTGGTESDEEFINFCNEKGISMVFTGMHHLSY